MFTIYMNRVTSNQHITVHDEHCSNVRKHGGVPRTYPPSGWYCEFFENARQAHWVANFMTKLTGWPIIKCPVCET